MESHNSLLFVQEIVVPDDVLNDKRGMQDRDFNTRLELEHTIVPMDIIHLFESLMLIAPYVYTTGVCNSLEAVVNWPGQ